jgi:hypothetical protein
VWVRDGELSGWAGHSYCSWLSWVLGPSVGSGRCCYCAVLCWVCGIDFRVGLGQLGELIGALVREFGGGGLRACASW